MIDHLAYYVGVGVVGAVTVVVLDGVVTRARLLNGHPIGRAAVRLAVAGLLAWGADRLGSRFVAGGVIAGAVLVTALDAGIALFPARRIEPPAARAGDLGAPWGPQPRYALSAVMSG